MQNGDHNRTDSAHSFSQPGTCSNQSFSLFVHTHQPPIIVGLILPTQLVQNQIHELAKTLPPPRKQNTACDACRSRKVKCNRLPGQDKCQHCLSKNYPCTSVLLVFMHYVQQATSEKKRSAATRRPRGISTSSRLFDGHRLSPSNLNRLRNSHSPVSENGTPPWSKSSFSSAPWNGRSSGSPSVSLQSTTPSLLFNLFAPPEPGPSESMFAFGALKSRSSAYSAWGEVAIKLEDEAYRAEFALDLVEVYFQIVHTRLPLLNPLQFRARLNLQAGGTRPIISNKQEEPLHPALIATVLAWGAKFSEHPLLVADRQRNGGQSSVAKALIERTRELAESLKVHRIPHVQHVVIALLIEPLQCQNPAAENGFHGFWLNCGIRNLLGLQINHKSVMADIKDPETRGTMIFAWWMACLADAFSAFYYRRKPMLDDDDYDIDFYTADPGLQEAIDPGKPSPREQLEFLGYYSAAHALARISRQIARLLWRPTTDLEGIPVEAAVQYSAELSKWRDAHLSKVGVPPNLAANWDFVSAVSACASDAQYHVMWIALFNAMDEYGVRDDSIVPSGMNQVETVKRKVFDEALNASLRVSALAGVLTSNGYLKLDPAVMHVSIIQAGFLLARLARPEVQNCIEGLEQYSYAYEETKETSQQIRREYEQALIKPHLFHEMSSAIPRPAAHSDSMSVDSITNGHGNGVHHAHQESMVNVSLPFVVV
ncbi:hypothetical protein HYDPIDRAFT_132385 [Hydnomerulius pinastri MD-312]|uniref:Zn(2)-C6 fungal-type domain-containing protein n=1 Tax=Hydnomerulius pinastri MD-312 TaxID=994086 RepID=A0A0C9WF47_9AGAM|nr:hypothetical protein HYDPIDRAFT_132385 [Hydnomerulius pinastri MD-312]